MSTEQSPLPTDLISIYEVGRSIEHVSPATARRRALSGAYGPIYRPGGRTMMVSLEELKKRGILSDKPQQPKHRMMVHRITIANEIKALIAEHPVFIEQLAAKRVLAPWLEKYTKEGPTGEGDERRSGVNTG
jgi:hypothetical protein